MKFLSALISVMMRLHVAPASSLSCDAAVIADSYTEVDVVFCARRAVSSSKSILWKVSLVVIILTLFWVSRDLLYL